jgi:YegS/Rv2252/BmrU family lipid kinase
MRRIPPLRLTGSLQDFGLHPKLALAETPAEALALTKRALAESSPPPQRVIAAGGDGTIHAILPALAGTSIPLAILPIGSVNVLARELGIPRSLPAAARIAALGVPRSIDLGRLQGSPLDSAQGRPFALMAGIGFDGAVVQRVRSRVKRRLGALAYVFSGLRLLLSFPSRRFTITCDGEKRQIKAWQVVIANAPSYTYHWSLAPHAKIDDGRLEVCILPHESALHRIKQVTAILLGKPHHAPVTYLSGRQIEIRAEPSAPLQMDGDPAPHVESAQIEILPQALTVMVEGKDDSLRTHRHR